MGSEMCIRDREVTVRRLKSQLPGKGFQQRRVEPLGFTPSTDEQTHFELLDRLLADSAKTNGRRGSGGIVAMLLKKRFLSSPWAFGMTMAHYLDSRAGGRALSETDYDDLFGEGQNDEEEGLFEQDEAQRLRDSKASDPLVSARPGELERLRQWGCSYENRPDTRLAALLTLLDAVCRPAGSWSNERVVVFTEYSHTVEWLERNLRQQGYGQVLAVIQGSTPTEERELIRQRFSADPATQQVRVLLATDAAGEGIDLQRHCHRLVNFDIPFNPSRLEQRIGRIDRYLQHFPPEVFHFVPVSSSSTYVADLGFMGRIAVKVANVEHDLGSVNEIIGAQIQGHFAKTGQSSRSRAGADGNAVINETLRGERELSARLTQLEQGYAQTKVDMHLEPANLRRVVDTALRLNRQPALREIGDDRTDAAVFAVPALSPGWQRALVGLDTRLEPGVSRPITFDDAAADGRANLVYVHLGHPIVVKAQRLLRRALWSADSPLHRVSAVVVDDLPESFVAAVTRMVLVGRGGLRLHEEIFLAGVRLKSRTVMAEERAEAMLDTALDSSDLTMAPPGAREWLAQAWNAQDSVLRRRLEESMARRAEVRHTKIADQLRGREQADVTRAGEIYAGFRRNLHESIAALTAIDAQEQLTLWPDDQRRQRERDIARMRNRRDELDDEQRREVDAIRARYADVKPHTMAAAVVFAMTPADAAQWGRH